MSGLDPVLVAALAAVGCGAAGLLVPPAIGRLPEPPPDAELAELAAAADERDLTTREQQRLGEGPKRLYADIAAAPALGPACSMASAALGLVAALVLGAHRDLVLYLPLVPVGVLLAVVDLRTRLLPARVVWAAGCYALAYLVVGAVLDGDPDQLVRAVTGSVVTFGVFYTLWWLHPPGMGYGDVRLSAVVGLLLAHRGWGELVVGVYASFVLFAVPALLLAVLHRSRDVLTRSFPFGPFLLLGVLVGLWAGAPAARLVGG